MILPELGLQFAYGRVAWTIVIAAAAVAVWPGAWRLPRRAVVLLTLALALLMGLPGAASPAYWLILACQWPSGLLVSLSVLTLLAAWQGQRGAPLLPPVMASALALAGAALYLDAIGVLSRGFYFWGFTEVQAPLAGLVLLGATAWAALMQRARPHALALLAALSAYAMLRLPTGNLWDAVLDPLLWVWALACSGVHLQRWLRGRSAARSVTPRPASG